MLGAAHGNTECMEEVCLVENAEKRTPGFALSSFAVFELSGEAA
jgi:hypothetical protein